MDVTRITGLASGMDTESLVQKLMKAERQPLDQLFRQRQLLIWKQEDLRSINSQLLSFKNAAFNLSLQSTFNQFNANSTDSSVATASVSGSANPTTVNLSITNLATAASSQSTVTVSADPANKINPDDTLANQQINFATNWSSTTFTITSFHQDGTSTTTNFTFDPNTESLNDVLSKINSDTALNVSAFYDAQSDRVVISSNETGNTNSTGADLQFTGDFLTGTLGLTDADGVDAQFTINGLATTRNSNSFEINGITYTLKNTGNTIITTSRDTEAIFNSIKDFVEQYNSLIDIINGELFEERYRDYPPLTDEQKNDMSDSEIEIWEQKARSGMLRNDSMLLSVVTSLQNDWVDFVSGVPAGEYDQMSDIGISTISYKTYGKLQIDEQKLRNAIESNSDQVMNLFTREAQTGETPEYNYNGIATRLNNSANLFIEQITDRAGSSIDFSMFDNSSLGKQIREKNEQMSKMELRLIEIEDRYWRQFTEMERALSMMNVQSQWLMQQFG